VPPRGRKKKVLFGGRLEGQGERTAVVLEVGPKFDLLALLGTAGCDLRAGDWRVEVRGITLPRPSP
ncbi:MAG: hypothetical protein ACK4WK_05060, partial [Anaerolineae bacterium]